MSEELNAAAPTWLAEEYARQLTRVLESMTGEAPYITFAPHELTEAELQAGDEGLLWWEQSFSLADTARIWIGARSGSWEEVGGRVLRGAGVEDQDRESIQSTYLEVLNQALSAVAGAISARVRREVTCGEGHQGPPADLNGLLTYSFEVTIGELSFPILAAYSQALVDLQEEPAALPGVDASQSALISIGGRPTNPIDLLLDVELPVSVSFGRAQLALKDVIKLTTGSIVELNRSISEPVEVIVNNCVIARGEVVVVEGNFGIRIKQVISRQERLRTLN
jgi:flagellar motor switch protein FliN/FliY